MGLRGVRTGFTASHPTRGAAHVLLPATEPPRRDEDDVRIRPVVSVIVNAPVTAFSEMLPNAGALPDVCVASVTMSPFWLALNAAYDAGGTTIREDICVGAAAPEIADTRNDEGPATASSMVFPEDSVTATPWGVGT